MSDIHYYSMRFEPGDKEYEKKLVDICNELKINYTHRPFHKSGKTVYEIACTPKEYDILVDRMFYNGT